MGEIFTSQSQLPPEETREHSIGFAIRTAWLHSTEGTEWLLKIQLQTATGMVHMH